jgi:FkbM family methyltransferase
MSLKLAISTWRSKCSKALREFVLRHYLVPDSRHGLPPALVRHWKPRAPLILIDVGASYGSFTTSVGKHHDISRALLVEPLAKRCAQLRETFKKPTFSVCQLALADFEGEGNFNVWDFDYASSLHNLPADKTKLLAGLELGQQRKLPVKVGTLDNLLEQEGIDGEIELLKMDAQGGELNILRGAQRSLHRIRNIWCEVAFSELYESAATFQNVFDFLEGRGFLLKAIGETSEGANGCVMQADVLFSRHG